MYCVAHSPALRGALGMSRSFEISILVGLRSWRCGSDGCHRVEDRELRVAALREEFYEAGLKPFSKSADDPRDEDIAFFYAEEANHDAEEAIFQELYGTTTTIPPGLEHVA